MSRVKDPIDGVVRLSEEQITKNAIDVNKLRIADDIIRERISNLEHGSKKGGATLVRFSYNNKRDKIFYRIVDISDIIVLDSWNEGDFIEISGERDDIPAYGYVEDRQIKIIFGGDFEDMTIDKKLLNMDINEYLEIDINMIGLEEFEGTKLSNFNPDENKNMFITVLTDLNRGGGKTQYVSKYITKNDSYEWIYLGGAGQDGKRGLTGPRGEIGPQGEIGPRGPRGYTGEEGPKGEKGDTGEMAPPIKIKDEILGSLNNLPDINEVDDLTGYIVRDKTGQTETYILAFKPEGSNEWIILDNWAGIPGPQGDTGDAGKDGIDGVDGKDGKDGISKTKVIYEHIITKDNYTFIDNINRWWVTESIPNIGYDILKKDKIYILTLTFESYGVFEIINYLSVPGQWGHNFYNIFSPDTFPLKILQRETRNREIKTLKYYSPPNLQFNRDSTDQTLSLMIEINVTAEKPEDLTFFNDTIESSNGHLIFRIIEI